MPDANGPGDERLAATPMHEWSRSILLFLLGLSMGLGAADGRRIPDAPNAVHIRQIARALADGPPSLRREFALLAITEMIEVYENEAELARRERQPGAARRDARRWALAVRRQAAELAGIVVGITESTSVQVGMTPYDRVFVVVDGRLVILTNPRMDEQIIFEQHVASRFCERNVCEDLPGITRQAESADVPPSIVPRWSFSDQAGPVCNAEDGLEIQFASVADLWWKRPACAAVSGELLTLAEQIALERGNGTPLDWNVMVIQPQAGSDLHRVVLNERGDYLLLRLPALSAVPEFFRLALPWLIARTEGVRSRLVVVNGERVLAPLSHPVD
ncbi:MAG: hypothetical protein LJE91_04815 [Gammaproteobacteria bacterium]|jgi:hypothetical protein|nr:hypothetical protein [Gammaproteobacteria bacterium]